jgi:hypothetical protein
MSRWADRLLLSFVLATTIVATGIFVVAAVDPAVTRDALVALTVPLFLLVAPAAVALHLVLPRGWLALECLPPYGDEARGKQR